MPGRVVDPFIKLFKFITGLTPNQLVTTISLTLVIIFAYLTFYTNEQNKALLLEKNKDTKDNSVLILECEARIRLSEEAHRRVYDAYRDKMDAEKQQRIKDFEEKYESVQVQQEKINEKVREADQIIARLKNKL